MRTELTNGKAFENVFRGLKKTSKPIALV